MLNYVLQLSIYGVNMQFELLIHSLYILFEIQKVIRKFNKSYRKINNLTCNFQGNKLPDT